MFALQWMKTIPLLRNRCRPLWQQLQYGKPNEDDESTLRFNNGQAHSHLDNNNGQGLPSIISWPRFVTLGLLPFALAIGIWQPFALAIGLPRFVTLGLWLLAFASWTVCTCNRITTAEVCHPRIMASCNRNWNLTTVCTRNRITDEGCHPRIMASCNSNWNLTTVCTRNRITAEVYHSRIMASCICKLNLTTVCNCNRMTMAEYNRTRSRLVTLGLFPNWNLTTVCICNRITTSRNCDSNLGVPSLHAGTHLQTSETTALHYSCNRMVWNGLTDPTYLQNLEHTGIQMTT